MRTVRVVFLVYLVSELKFTRVLKIMYFKLEIIVLLIHLSREYNVRLNYVRMPM